VLFTCICKNWKCYLGIQDDVAELQNTTEVGTDVTNGAAANKQKRKHDLKGIDNKKVKRSSKDEHIDTEEAASKKMELKSVEGILQTSAAGRPMESNSATVIQALSGSAVFAGDVGTLTIVQNPLTSQRKEKLRMLLFYT